MIKCHHCGNNNLSSAEFCDECGVQLTSITEHSFAPPPPPSFLCDDLKPNPVRPISPISRLFEESDGTKTSVARLVLMSKGLPNKEFLLTKTELLIGRWDASRNIFPDIDLDQADLETKVSRRHARVFLKDQHYWIEDLGSLNGTIINRQHRLQKGQPFMLQNGDEIIVGKTFLKFSIA